MSLIYSTTLRLLPLAIVLFVGIVFALPSVSLAQSQQQCSSFGTSTVEYYASRGEEDNAIMAIRCNNSLVPLGRNDQGTGALRIAAERGLAKLVTALLTVGVPVDGPSNYTLSTPLFRAARFGHPDILHILLSANADINGKNRASPLWGAVEGRHVEVFNILLSNNADVNGTVNVNSRPLHAAARHDSIGIATTLLARGAIVNVERSDNKWTPLHYAARYGSPEMVSILIAANASINVTSTSGFTPLHLAANYRTQNVPVLLNAGAVPSENSHCHAINQQFIRVQGCVPCPDLQRVTSDNSCQVTQEYCESIGQVYNFNRFFCDPAPANSGGGGSGGGSAGLYIGLGVVALGGLYLFTSTDIIGTYNFSPTYHYELNDNEHSYRAGLQGNYVTDNWHLYYAVDGNDSDDELRYSTGAVYSGSLWNATFNEEVKGDNVDYDFSFSTKISGGNWEFKPIYTLHSRHENLSTNWQTKTNNSLNLQGMWYNTNWTLKSSASFQWKSANEFGKKRQFNLSLTRQF